MVNFLFGCGGKGSVDWLERYNVSLYHVLGRCVILNRTTWSEKFQFSSSGFKMVAEKNCQKANSLRYGFFTQYHDQECGNKCSTN